MTQEQMLNKLLDSDSYLITHTERKMLDIWDLRDQQLDKRDLQKLIEIYDRVFTYGVE